MEHIIAKGVLVRLPGAASTAIVMADQISRTLVFDEGDSATRRLSAMKQLLDPRDEVYVKLVYINPLDSRFGTMDAGCRVECSMITVSPVH